jgi:hypothetical protein
MIAILEQAGAGDHLNSKKIEARMLELEKQAIGNEVCYSCTHRSDSRPWWKKLFWKAKSSDYECLSFSRTPVRHPVTGETRYFAGHFGNGDLVLARSARRHCEDMNPDGHCPKFKVALRERSGHWESDEEEGLFGDELEELEESSLDWEDR